MSDESKVVPIHTAHFMRKQTRIAIFQALQTVNQSFGDCYVHYKSADAKYWLIAKAKDTVTNGDVVIYMNILGQIFTRPLQEFFGYVDDECTKQRFTKTED